jgi:hypothetical protein
VDDNVVKRVAEVAADEPHYLSKTIFPTVDYHWTGFPEACAQKIAQNGGVAWQHPNGLWVYSKLEKNGKTILTCDTKPRKAIKIIRPELPLQWNGSGYTWRTYNG